MKPRVRKKEIINKIATSAHVMSHLDYQKLLHTKDRKIAELSVKNGELERKLQETGDDLQMAKAVSKHLLTTHQLWKNLPVLMYGQSQRTVLSDQESGFFSMNCDIPITVELNSLSEVSWSSETFVSSDWRSPHSSLSSLQQPHSSQTLHDVPKLTTLVIAKHEVSLASELFNDVLRLTKECCRLRKCLDEERSQMFKDYTYEKTLKEKINTLEMELREEKMNSKSWQESYNRLQQEMKHLQDEMDNCDKCADKEMMIRDLQEKSTILSNRLQKVRTEASEKDKVIQQWETKCQQYEEHIAKMHDDRVQMERILKPGVFPVMYGYSPEPCYMTYPVLYKPVHPSVATIWPPTGNDHTHKDHKKASDPQLSQKEQMAVKHLTSYEMGQRDIYEYRSPGTKFVTDSIEYDEEKSSDSDSKHSEGSNNDSKQDSDSGKSAKISVTKKAGEIDDKDNEAQCNLNCTTECRKNTTIVSQSLDPLGTTHTTHGKGPS